MFDMETRESMAQFEEHEDDVNCLASTTDGRFLVSGSEDKSAKVWDMTNDFAIVAVCEIGYQVLWIDNTPGDQRNAV